MRSPRRSVFVVVLGLLAGLGIAACGKAQPGVAFYIGGTRYTEKQIDEIVDEVGELTDDRARVRESVVNALVLRDLGRRAAAEKSVNVPAADYQGTAQRLRFPEQSGLNRVVAESSAVANALVEAAPPAQPTEKDLRDIYDAAVGLYGDQTKPYDEIAQALKSDPFLPRILGVRNLISEQAKKVDVVVNPRYLPLTAQLGEVPVPITEGIGAVVDAR